MSKLDELARKVLDSLYATTPAAPGEAEQFPEAVHRGEGGLDAMRRFLSRHPIIAACLEDGTAIGGDFVVMRREDAGIAIRMMRELGALRGHLIEIAHHGPPGFLEEEAARQGMPAKAADRMPPPMVMNAATGRMHAGDQVPGMPSAICHACGLGRACGKIACPNGWTP